MKLCSVQIFLGYSKLLKWLRLWLTGTTSVSKIEWQLVSAWYSCKYRCFDLSLLCIVSRVRSLWSCVWFVLPAFCKPNAHTIVRKNTGAMRARFGCKYGQMNRRFPFSMHTTNWLIIASHRSRPTYTGWHLLKTLIVVGVTIIPGCWGCCYCNDITTSDLKKCLSITYDSWKWLKWDSRVSEFEIPTNITDAPWMGFLGNS